jgi:P4 family phage/plasmid primase-like protien
VNIPNKSQDNYTNYGSSSLNIPIEPIPNERLFKINNQNKQVIDVQSIADSIRARNKIITTIEDDLIWVKDEFENVYKPIGKYIIEQELSHASKSYLIDISINKRREIINEIKNLTVQEKEVFVEHNKDLIHVQNVKNGIILVEIPKFIPHVFDYSMYDESNYEKYYNEYVLNHNKLKFLSKLPLIYDKNATPSKFQKFLEYILPDVLDQQTIYEIFGYCLLKSYPIQKFFLLVGEGANGKTTLLSVLENFLGHENVTNCSLHQLLDRFGPANLYLKSANIQGDLDSKDIKNLGILKDIVSGAWLSAEFKGKNHFEFQNYAKIIIPCNKIPRPKESDLNFAYYRRVNIIRFNVVIPPEKQMRQDKLMEEISNPDELSGILNKAIEGLERLLKNNKFSNSDKQGNIEKETEKLQDTAVFFVNNFVYKDQEFGRDYFVNDIFLIYQKWCISDKLPKQSKKRLITLLKNQSNIKENLKRKTNPNTDKKEAYIPLLSFDEEIKKFKDQYLINYIKSSSSQEPVLSLRLRIERIFEQNSDSILFSDIINLLKAEISEFDESKVVEIIENLVYNGNIHEQIPGTKYRRI